MRFCFSIILTFIFTLPVHSQKKDLKAFLDSKQFYAPGIGNYIEFQLQFIGYTLNYVGENNGLRGELAIQMQLLQNDSIVNSDAYRLSTPFMKDSIIEDFYDVKRFQLEPGNYLFKLTVQDLNSDNAPLYTSQRFLIEDLSDAVSMSDIEIAEIATKGDESSPFYKSGFTIIPRLNPYYPEELNVIPVYLEIYNSNIFDDSVFAIKQTITDLSLNKTIDELTTYTKYKTAEVVPFLKKVNIEGLATGKYLLTYTIVNKSMIELSSRSYEFDRHNRVDLDFALNDVILDPAFQASIPDDSIGYFLESLVPISGRNEMENIYSIVESQNKEARKYIQTYWVKTNPVNPYEAWIKYKQQVYYVETLFANNFEEGFETDRGRVYLKYGAPSNIIREPNSSSEYPYEIWYYNKIGVYNNKRFIFYNTDGTLSTYRLLHSDMIGELKNPNWSYELVKRNTAPGNADNPGENMIDQWGGKGQERIKQY